MSETPNPFASFEELLTPAPKKPFSLKGDTDTDTDTPADAKSVHLNIVALKDLNLESELARQYAVAKVLLEDARHDDEVALNQKAQALNSITAILQAIIKLQQELYSIERLKVLEDVLVTTLQGFPEIKLQFLAEYEVALKKVVK